MLDLTDEVFGSLTVLERAPSVGKHGYWRVECNCGTRLAVRTDSLRKGTSRSCGCESPRFERIDTPTYNTAHCRTRRARGSARQHPCGTCDQQASEWAYQNQCPDEVQGEANGYPVTYCPVGGEHPDCYAPRCVPCHRQQDSDSRRSAA